LGGTVFWRREALKKRSKTSTDMHTPTKKERPENTPGTVPNEVSHFLTISVWVARIGGGGSAESCAGGFIMVGKGGGMGERGGETKKGGGREESHLSM